MKVHHLNCATMRPPLVAGGIVAHCLLIETDEGLVGWGSALAITATGASRFHDAGAWWRAVTARAVVRDEVDIPGTGLVCFGSFPFADDSGEAARLVNRKSGTGGRPGDREENAAGWGRSGGCRAGGLVPGPGTGRSPPS